MAAISSIGRMWGAIDMTATWRPLREGDVFRQIDGTHHYVEYVNSSGAYCIPLKTQIREINGQSISFTAGGRTISANAVVQIIHPLELGGNSQEYRAYVKLESKNGRKGHHGMADPNAKGASFGDFVDQPLSEIEMEAAQAEAEGAAATTSGKAGKKEKAGMAKKAAASAKKANGTTKAAKRDKTPKTVRKCVCGCGGETTGHFCPGHDARFHGWLKKLATGKMGPGELPASVRKGLDLVQTKEGFKAKSPEFYKEA